MCHWVVVNVIATESFESEILITITGNLDESIEELCIEEVEVVNPIDTIHFGTLELDYGEYD